MRYRTLVLAVAVGAGIGVVGGSGQAAAEPGWTRHTINAEFRGADGVDLRDVNRDGLPDIATGWEEAGVVTVALNPGPDAVTGPWERVVPTTALRGVEDAIIADVDADGRMDVVTACECQRLTVYFGPESDRMDEPGAWTAVDLPTQNQRWIKVAVADIDGDRRLDIIGGGKVTPATVGWFRAPANPRTGSAWTYTVMSPVAWTMSLTPKDVDTDGRMDVVLSDRLPIIFPDGSRRNDLRGSRWLRNNGPGAEWTNHRIGFGEGETKFLHITDFDRDGVEDVLDGVSGTTHNRTFFRRNLGDWLSWTATQIPQPAGVGHYQDVATGDLDLDGDTDLAFSYSHAEGDVSGVVVLAANPNGTWTRVEVSGPPGTKYDNIELLDLDGDDDLDIITTEQVEQLGVIWYENPAR